MSHVVDHVDETQLHAYLDRELEFADPEVRKAVGLHIADCSRCSNLLKEVRLVHQQAERLMDVANPASRPTPSFREIVRRAADRRQSTEHRIPMEVDQETDSDHNTRFRRMDDSEPFTLDPLDELISDDSTPEGKSEGREPQQDSAEHQQPSEPADAAVQFGQADDEIGDVEDSGVFIVEDDARPAQEPDQSLEITLSGSIENDLDWLDAGPGAEPETGAENQDARDNTEVDQPSIEQPGAEPAHDDEVLFIQPEATSENAKGGPSGYDDAGVVYDPGDEPTAIPSEEDVVFIEAHKDIVPIAGTQTPEVVTSVEDEQTAKPPRAAKRVPVRTRRSRIPILARAAVVILAVGIGGWYARPFVMERFAPSTLASSAEQLASDAASNDDAAFRQNAQEGAGEADVPAAPLFDSVVPAPATESESLAGAAAGAASAPVAQAPVPAGNVVTGTVRDAETGQAVAEALILVAGTGQVTTTDDSGRYTIANVPAGSLQVGVRQVGYETISKTLSVGENRSSTADFDLRGAQVALDELVVTGAAEPERRARAERSDVDASAETEAIELPRDVAETILGGPIVAVDGMPIRRIARTVGGTDVIVDQAGVGDIFVSITITSPGDVGENATLEGVEVLGDESAERAVGSARYGNYRLTISANVSLVELESLVRRITVAPEVN
jgi:hypothetical protein